MVPNCGRRARVMRVRQAANVLELIEFFAARGAPATLAEIATSLAWPRSSTFNLVGTLAEDGYLYEPQHKGHYFPSPKWSLIGQSLANADPLPARLRDLVDAVSGETDETAAIGGVTGQSVVFLHVRESRQPIRYIAEVGTTVPIHASSAGRAILAQMSRKEREAMYRKINFEQWSDTTPMSADAIEEQLRRAKIRGWHQSDSEFIADLAGVALPVPHANRRLSIVVAGPVSRCLARRDEIAGAIKRVMGRLGIGFDRVE